MSTPWSGRIFWAAAAVAALAISPAAASNNDAIVVTPMTEQGLYDVSLEISQLELWPGLASWEDLAFTSLQKPWFSEHNGTLETHEWEMLAVLDIASGTLCQETEGCLGNIATHYQSLCDLELLPHVVEKRFRYIYKWINSGWKTSKKHSITAAALGALSSTVGGATDAIIKLSRSAICAKDNGNQACISWAGGVQAIKRGIALDIISSAQGTFGQDAVSGEEYAAVFDKSTKRKRAGDDVCISNRPNGCT